jgi:eukaryotic-like serine/threonine-protein kinase
MRGEPFEAAGVREGDVIGGKYRVDSELGAGAMGVVVSARHLVLGTTVAIKLLRPAMVQDREAVARFMREARAAAQLTNEHVAHVLDVDRLDSGAPYMVMELLEGFDLAHWLRMRGRLTLEQAAEFVLQTCEAVAEAHEMGIVHRDLKPANLFCIRRPNGLMSIKVLDFGISKITRASGNEDVTEVTQASALMGSPPYISPEQLDSPRDVDTRTDIWAFGVILYELLTGSLPFYAQRIPELCIKIATQQQPPLRSLRPELPQGIEIVVRRCLEKDRSRRYPNVVALALALAEFAPKRARVSVVRIMRTMRAAGLSTTGLTVPERPPSLPVLSWRPGVSLSMPPESRPPPLPDLSDRPSYHTASRSINPFLQKSAATRSRTKQLSSLGTLGGAIALIIALGTGLAAQRSTTTAQGHAEPITSPPPAIDLQAPAPATTPAAPAAPSPLPSAGSPDNEPTTALQANVADAGSGKPLQHATTMGPPATPSLRTKTHNATANPECAAPFSIDSEGVKRYKPQCL